MHRSRGQRLVSLYAVLHVVVNVGIAASAAGLTAFVALLAEDQFPRPNEVRQALWTSRLWMAFACMLSLFTCLWLRQVLRRKRGTLYYLRYLESWMQDTHSVSRQVFQNQHLDSRIVARSVTAEPTNGVRDVADELTEMAHALQAAMNDDSSTTGFQVAPNLLWAPAIRLGFDWYTWDQSTLEDLGEPSKGEPPFSWRLEPQAVRSRAVPVPVWVDGPGHDCAVTSVRLLANLTGDVRFGGVPGLAGVEQRIGVHMPGFPTNPVGSSHCTGCFSGKVQSEEAYTSVVQPVRVATSRRSLRKTGTVAGRPVAVVHPWDALSVLGTSVQQLLHDHPDAPIVLSIRVPKTIAFALGWWLANQSPSCAKMKCAQRSCRDPWSRLIPVSTGPNPGGVWRVHPAQPDAATLTRRVRTGRL